MTVKPYKTENGIRKYNRQAYVPTATAVAVPFTNASTALAVVSAPQPDDEEIVVTPMYEAAVTQYHETVEPEIFVGIDDGDDQPASAPADGGLEELNTVMAKYEVPAGMLSKLLELSRFAAAEIIVDDSGSMRLPTDAKGPRGEPLTRWWEAKWRISQMIELMAYVISPPITICFLNRADVLHVARNAGESPSAYIDRAESALNAAFNVPPAGRTPALEAIDASLRRHPGQAVLRYFLGDGVPNGGDYACRQIESMLINRPSPECSPFTFMSCTGNDDDVEWMKECEEKAPYCSEFDDYGDESREILKDQGKAFPYSFGLHLVAQIVAAFNPSDLDAMDESVPFTRQTLSNLMGYQSSSMEYRYYFDSFLEAQRRLPMRPFQRTFVNKLPSLYAQFESASSASTIPDVVEYKLQVKNYAARSAVRSTAPAAQDDCCVIL
jgi:hypothetical protein